MNHSIDGSSISEFLSQGGQFQQEFTNQDNSIFYVLPGIKVQQSFGARKLGLAVNYGFSNASYPSFKSELQYLTSPDIYWRTVG